MCGCQLRDIIAEERDRVGESVELRIDSVCEYYKIVLLTPIIPPTILPLMNMYAAINPLRTNINNKLTLINREGMHIIMGRVMPVNTMAMPPKIKVAYMYPV